jgi:hypothetical protein
MPDLMGHLPHIWPAYIAYLSRWPARRWIEAAMAVFYGFAGLKLLASRL